jgi:hypothetical protein
MGMRETYTKMKIETGKYWQEYHEEISIMSNNPLFNVCSTDRPCLLYNFQFFTVKKISLEKKLLSIITRKKKLIPLFWSEMNLLQPFPELEIQSQKQFCTNEFEVPGIRWEDKTHQILFSPLHIEYTSSVWHVKRNDQSWACFSYGQLYRMHAFIDFKDFTACTTSCFVNYLQMFSTES